MRRDDRQHRAGLGIAVFGLGLAALAAGIGVWLHHAYLERMASPVWELRKASDQVQWATIFDGIETYSAIAGFGLGVVAMALAALVWHVRLIKASEHAVTRAQSAVMTDQMTGLLNRSGFFTQVEAALAISMKNGLGVALLYIDLDHFKGLNDSYGHAAGDDLLRTVSQRLRAFGGQNVMVGRLGGDEFAICMHGVQTMEAADTLSRRVCEALHQPCDLGGHLVVPSASIGYAMAPDDADRITDLARFADIALYAAKAAGRGTWRGFEPYMMLELDQRRELERLVREATETSSFELNYQPLVSAHDQRLTGFEALLRLRTPEGRYISPTVFIPIAEDIGLIKEIGAWVLTHACHAACLWPDHLKLAVNLSPLQFRDFSIADTVKVALRDTGFPAARLQLEITEGLLLLKSEDIMTQLAVLKEQGVDLAMDDFGSGYCSLSYLWKFPFDTIKIDRSFVQGLHDQAAPTGSILASVLQMAHSLRLSVTVEGIETEEQADYVRSRGCHTLQGFLFGAPMSLGDAAAFIAKDLAKDIPARFEMATKPRLIA